MTLLVGEVNRLRHDVVRGSVDLLLVGRQHLELEEKGKAIWTFSLWRRLSNFYDPNNHNALARMRTASPMAREDAWWSAFFWVLGVCEECGVMVDDAFNVSSGLSGVLETSRHRTIGQLLTVDVRLTVSEATTTPDSAPPHR